MATSYRKNSATLTGAVEVIRCDIWKSRELAASLALKYMNLGFPMYATLTQIPIYNLSPVKGFRVQGLGFRVWGLGFRAGEYIPCSSGSDGQFGGSGERKHRHVGEQAAVALRARAA